MRQRRVDSPRSHVDSDASCARTKGEPLAHLFERMAGALRSAACAGAGLAVVVWAAVCRALRSAAHLSALADASRNAVSPSDAERTACLQHWVALQRESNPSKGEIRRRFRAVALLVHPDKGGDAAIFRECVAARDRLLRQAVLD